MHGDSVAEANEHKSNYNLDIMTDSDVVMDTDEETGLSLGYTYKYTTEGEAFEPPRD